jgi:hypothetical protein
MVENVYRQDHHAGKTAEERLRARERNSGQSYPDQHSAGTVRPDRIVRSARDRTITNVFDRSQNRGNGAVRFQQPEVRPSRGLMEKGD